MESFHFFTFCSVFKIRKNIFDVIILFTDVLGDIRGSIKLLKKFQEDIRRNCTHKVHFGSIRWERPKLRSKRTLKMPKIEKTLMFLKKFRSKKKKKLNSGKEFIHPSPLWHFLCCQKNYLPSSEILTRKWQKSF